MALINCPECGKEVSDQAAACPSCAYPLHPMSALETRSEPKKNHRWRWIAFAIFIGLA